MIITLFILSQNREVKFEQYLIYAEEVFNINLLRILRDTNIQIESSNVSEIEFGPPSQIGQIESERELTPHTPQK